MTELEESLQRIPADPNALVAAAHLILGPRRSLIAISRGIDFEVAALHPFGAANGREALTALRRICSAAAVLLNEAIRLAPSNGEAFALLAQVYEDIEDWGSAAHCRKRAIQCGEPIQKNTLALANDLIALRRFDDAVARVTAIYPDLPSDMLVFESVSFENLCDLQKNRVTCLNEGEILYCDIHAHVDCSSHIVPHYINQSSMKVLHINNLSIYNRVLLKEDSSECISESVNTNTGLYIEGALAYSKGGAIFRKIDKEVFIDEPCIILSGFRAHYENYYHTLAENFSRIRLILNDERFRRYPLLVPDNLQPWAIDFLRRVGIDENRLRSAPIGSRVNLSEALLASPPTFGRPINQTEIAATRRALLPPDRQVRKGKRLFIERRATSDRGRLLVNEAVIASMAEAHGFTPIDPGTLTIGEQIDLFSDAEIICGPTGAGLTNALYAPEGAKVICLSPRETCRAHFANLSIASGLEFHWCLGSFIEETTGSGYFPHLPYSVPTNNFQYVLDSI